VLGMKRPLFQLNGLTPLMMNDGKGLNPLDEVIMAEQEQLKQTGELYDIYYQVSTAIFNYRMSHGLTQQELADKLDVSMYILRKCESGDYEYSLKQIWEIANKLGMKLTVKLEDPALAPKKQHIREIPIDIESVKDRLFKGEPVANIANDLGTSISPVYRALKSDLGMHYRNFMKHCRKVRHSIRGFRNPHSLYQQYLRMGSLQAVADHHGVSRQAIHQQLKKAGYSMSLRRHVPVHQEQEIVRLRTEEDLTIDEVTSRLGIKRYRVMNVLRKHKLPLTHRMSMDKRRGDKVHAPSSEIEMHYNRGMTIHELAELYDVSVPTIIRRMRAANIQRRPRGHVRTQQQKDYAKSMLNAKNS